jgi:hypothetical protein
MVDSFRNSDGNLSPPSNSGTEFERSIARNGENGSDPPSDFKEKINEDTSSIKDAAVASPTKLPTRRRNGSAAEAVRGGPNR